MKILLSILFIGFLGGSFAQDTTKIEQSKISRAPYSPAKQHPFALSKKTEGSTAMDADINGSYIIEQYSIHVNTMKSKEAIKAVGTGLIIEDNFIAGPEIDSIQYQISETVMMDTKDYLFRVFGVAPEEIPNDLPLQLKVHKTNNLDCYGIGELPNGQLLIPYNGLLFYLSSY